MLALAAATSHFRTIVALFIGVALGYFFALDTPSAGLLLAFRAPSVAPATDSPLVEPSQGGPERCPTLQQLLVHRNASLACPKVPPEQCPTLEQLLVLKNASLDCPVVAQSSPEPCLSLEQLLVLRNTSIDCPKVVVNSAASTAQVPDSTRTENTSALPPHSSRASLRPAGGWCGTDTTLHWTGDWSPYGYAQDDTECEWPVPSLTQLLRRFAGKRLLFIGDSMTRELMFDLVRHAAGCGTSIVKDSLVKFNKGYNDSDVLGPSSAWARRTCDYVNDGSSVIRTSDVVISLSACGGVPCGADPDLAPVELEFIWRPRIGQMRSAGGTRKRLVEATTFDAVTIGSYHWYTGKGLKTAEAYLKEVKDVVDLLVGDMTTSAPSSLRSKLYWRTPPLSRYPTIDMAALTPADADQVDVINNAILVPTSARAAAIWRDAGFRVLPLNKYFVHADCTAAGEPVSGAKICPPLTIDGVHPMPGVNLAMMRELLSAMWVDGVV